MFNTVNSDQTLFSGQAQVAQKSLMIKIYQYSEKFQGNSVFRAGACCSKIPNVKKYTNTMKNFRASAICSKILNDKIMSIQ